jgi:hypothetical protein
MSLCIRFGVRGPACLKLGGLLTHDRSGVVQNSDLIGKRLQLLLVLLRRKVSIHDALVCERFDLLAVVQSRAEVSHNAFVEENVDDVVPRNILRQHLSELCLHLIVAQRNRSLRGEVPIRLFKWQHLLNLFQCGQKVVLLNMFLVVVFEVFELFKKRLQQRQPFHPIHDELAADHVISLLTM